MMAWALFCHDFDLSKGINILSEKCPVVLDHYTMPDNTIGHSVPVYYLDGRTGDMMVRFPDGHEEKSGKTYPGLIQHIGE